MKFAVLGSKTSASLSPRLHLLIYKLIKLNHSYSYIETQTINPSILFNYDGLNITNPFKNNIIQYLDQLDPIALKTQSVNCIKVIDNIKIGYNTDYYGFDKSIKVNGVDFTNKKIIVLGAGGVSSTICRYLADNHLTFKIINRTPEKLKLLINRLNLSKSNIIKSKSLDSVEYDIIINCLPSSANVRSYLKVIGLGTKPINIYIDMNYNIKSNFIASINADKTIDGVDMLIFQAIKSIEIWMENDILDSVDYHRLRKHIIEN
jgi:shikimate dehydrogenase